MYNFKKISLFVVFVLFFASSNVQAQDLSTPTSAWLVGPVSAAVVGGQTPQGMPCVAVNQFSNGYTLRLSGGDGRLLAMALDTRAAGFTRRQKYDVAFAVPGRFFQLMSGSAYDESTLLFGLSHIPEFYEALESAETLEISIGDNKATLSMAGLRQGLQRMNSCAGAVPATAPAPVSAPSPKHVQNPSPRQNPLLAQNQNADLLTPLPGEVEEAQAPAPAPKHPRIDPALFNLSQKAEQAQQAAKALSGQKTPNDAGDTGTPQTSQTAGHSTVVNVARTWSDPTIRRADPSDIMGRSVASALQGDAARPMRWRALRGANLQNTFEVWANAVGVKLVWTTDQDYAVRQSIVIEGPFDQAAMALLEQFGDTRPRPVGRVYREPGSNQLVLVVGEIAD